MEEKKATILIVDDDEDTRVMYAEVFKRAGFEVVEAMDGLEGLDQATKVMPDIIFTGIIMPRMDGFALKEALAKNIATADIPVLMNSHMGREEDRVRAKEMGVRDFIVRGMTTPKEVVEKAKIMIGNSSKGYKLKIVAGELDAPELVTDLDLNQDMSCKNCGNGFVFEISIGDVGRREFTGRIMCPNCNK